MQSNIIDLNLENFRPVMLEESTKRLVTVYFYAHWDEGSMTQLEVIKNFATNYPEHILLATVNCDEQPEIVQQFGVRGLPTTMIVQDGQPVDGFSGPQDATQLKATFAKYIPKPEDELFTQAKEFIAQGDYQQSFALLKQANELDPSRMDIVIAYSDASVETGNLDLAKRLIQQVGLVDQQADYHAVVSKIELAEKASESPELLELQAKHAANPEDLQLKIDYAVALQQAHKQEQALELLYEVVRKDMSFGDGKKLFLDTINALADGDPLKSQYRRKMYSLLY